MAIFKQKKSTPEEVLFSFYSQTIETDYFKEIRNGTSYQESMC